MKARVKSVVSPQNKGYSQGGASAQKRVFKGFNAVSSSPTEDINANNYTLRQRCRVLYMSAPIAAGALKRVRTNVVGPGLRLKCTIDRDILGMTQDEAEAWQRKTQAEFALWATNKRACDATGVNNFYGMQQLALLSWLMSGDVFALTTFSKPTDMLPYSLRLKLIEADRCRTPMTGASVLTVPDITTGETAAGNKIFDGVEVDNSGAITAYHFCNTYPEQLTVESLTYTRVLAYGEKSGLPNVLHVMDTERCEQYRGVPYLAQVIEPLLQMNRYTEAEIMAAVVQSFFTAFITTNADASEVPCNSVYEGESTEGIQCSGGEASAGSNPDELELGVGTINVLEPGESVNTVAPTHPNNGFEAFFRAMCEQVGAALEIPADLLMMSFNSSYSASRAALLEAWKAFRMRREWLADDFCRPAYEIWMSEAVAIGRIKAPGFFSDPLIRQAYLKSEWIGPSQGQLDPTKEVSAAVTAIENGLSTHETEAIRLNGSEFSANAEKLAVENKQLSKAGTQKQQTPPVLVEPEEKEEEENLDGNT